MVKEKKQEKIEYACDICGTTYNNKEAAERCEKSLPSRQCIDEYYGRYPLNYKRRSYEWFVGDYVYVFDYNTNEKKVLIGKITNERLYGHEIRPIIHDLRNRRINVTNVALIPREEQKTLIQWAREMEKDMVIESL